MPRNRQPQGPTRISAEFRAGLCFAFSPALQGFTDSAVSGAFKLQSVPPIEMYPDGYGFKYVSGGGGTNFLPATNSFNAVNAFTLLCLCYPQTPPAYSGVICTADNTNKTFLGIDNTGKWFIQQTADNGYLDGSLSYLNDQLNCIAGSTIELAVTDARITALNGELDVRNASSQAGAVGVINNSGLIGQDVFGTGRTFIGGILLAAVWNYRMSPQLIQRLSGNPWTIFEPIKRYFPFGAAVVNPTLTAAEAFNITTSSAQARVTFTRP
jgi:hypothetical protein